MNRAALVIGESLIDVVSRDGNVVGEHVGGSPLNVAVGLARLGRDVTFLTRFGDDPHGSRIAEHLRSAGVQVTPGSVSASATSVARADLDATGAANYQFEINWQLSATPPTAPPLVLHTGSIATWLEPGAQAVAALVDSLRVAATISFDPNVRPALADADTARARIDHLVRSCDVVKASDEDVRWLFPDVEPEQIAAGWLQSGPALVAVTGGPSGAFAVCRAGSVTVAAPAVEVVDTVGAGDSFTTGILDELWTLGLLGADVRTALRDISTESLHRVLQTAVRNSSVTVTHAGAHLPNRAERDGAST